MKAGWYEKVILLLLFSKIDGFRIFLGIKTNLTGYKTVILVWCKLGFSKLEGKLLTVIIAVIS